MNQATLPTTSSVERLLTESGGPLISLYMPTHRAGAAIWQDPIRFKNLVRSAQHELETLGHSRLDVEHLLAPLAGLRDDRKFWQNQSDGLAVFRSADSLDVFHLPAAVPELCVVRADYHLKPMLMSLADERTFYVLALSQHQVRLLRGTPSGIGEVAVVQCPPAGSDGRNHTNRRAIHAHATGNGSRVTHGSSEIDWKDQIASYCREIDRKVGWIAAPHIPVIPAGVDYVVNIFRDQTTLKTLTEESIAGCPDGKTPDQLFAEAMPIVEAEFAKHRALAESEFHRAVRTGRALDQPLETFEAARLGRVELLFVPIGVQIWGKHPGQGESFSISEQRGSKDQDLLNVALIDTWKSGGRVVAIPPASMPGGRSIAAVVRY